MIRRLRGTRDTAMVNSTLAEAELSSLVLLLTATTASRTDGSSLQTISVAEYLGSMMPVNAFLRIKEAGMKSLNPPRMSSSERTRVWAFSLFSH